MANPLQWMQSATPTDAWAAPQQQQQQQQQQPDYQSALSQAWHASYSKNNPMAYEQNYGGDPSSPYYAEGMADIQRAAADVTRRRMGGPAWDARDPQHAADVQQAYDRFAQGVTDTVGSIHPLGVAGHMVDAFSTRVGSGEAMSAPELRKQQIKALEDQIAAEQKNRDAALNTIPRDFSVYDAEGRRSKGRDPTLVKSKTSSFEQNISRLQEQLSPLYAAQSSATSTQEKSEEPFAAHYPWAQTAADIGGPAASALTGFGIGRGAMSAIKYGAKPLKAVLAGMGLGGTAGFFEGDLSGSIPVNVDLDKPPGSVAHQNALAQLPSWLPDSGVLNRTNVGPFLSDRAIRKGLQSAGVGALSVLGTMHGALRGLGSQSNALAPSVSSTGNALKPSAVNIDAAGRDIHLGANGRAMFQDKNGNWQHVGGGMVKKEHWPSWY